MRSSGASIPIRILTHNIRYATTSPFEGEEPWPTRRPYLLNELRFNTAHNPEAFIACQVVLHDQLLDLLNGLNAGNEIAEWAYIGVGRNNGKEAGEYSPIFYRPAVWQLQYFKTVWVSDTPDVPSKHPNASSIRIVTIGKFSHIKEKKTILALNTHLDDGGSLARLDGARIIADRAQSLSQAEDGSALPVWVTGDFNSEPSGGAYKYMINNATFSDVYNLVPVIDHYGDQNTFTGFKSNGQTRIDFIFTRYNTKGDPSSTPWTVRNYAVLSSKYEDGVYNSDHRAVVADLVLN